MQLTCSYRKYTPFLLVFLLAALSSCEKYPRDPHKTLEKVKSDTLSVGITENPPYVIFGDYEPSGSEINLIKAFAEELNAEIRWVKGPEEQIMTLLESNQVQLCAGGFNSKSLWKKHVHFVKPHDTLIYKWGSSTASSLSKDLKNKKAYVEKGSKVAAFVHKMGGAPILIDSLSTGLPLVAGPVDELRKKEYSISEDKLKEERIALAIPKGENAFLEKVDKFIGDYEGESNQ